MPFNVGRITLVANQNQQLWKSPATPNEHTSESVTSSEVDPSFDAKDLAGDIASEV